MRRLLVRSSGRRRRPRSVPWPPSPAATASSISSRSSLSIQWHPPPSSAALLGRPHALCIGGGISRAFSSPYSSSSASSTSSSGAVAEDGASSSLTPAAADGGGSAPEPDPAEVAAAAAAARQEFLQFLEPADAAHAVTLLETAEQVGFGRAKRAWWCEGACLFSFSPSFYFASVWGLCLASI